jgi:hypothetical protein
MNVNVTLKSIQFWIKPTAIMQFADVLEKLELPNCIVGTDNGAVVVEMDYDPADIVQAKQISELQGLAGILHHEHLY